MNQEQFRSLPKEHQLEIVKSYTEGLSGTVSARIGILPSISALSAALLIIATFNNLLPFNAYVKFLLSILLILIPASLFLYNEDLKTAQKQWKENLEEILPGSKARSDKERKTILNKLTAYFPDVAILIISIISISIILMVWHNSQKIDSPQSKIHERWEYWR